MRKIIVKREKRGIFGRVAISDKGFKMSDVLRIVCVDDEAYITESIRDYLDSTVSCLTFNDSLEALESLKVDEADILIADYRMPGLNGLQLLREAGSRNAYSKAVLLTAYADKDVLKDVLNNRLVDHVLEKPLNLPELTGIIEKLAADISGEKDAASERQRLSEVYSLLSDPGFDFDFIGKTGDLRELWNRTLNVAQTDENILITGDTGSGKDVLARQIHNNSKRAGRPFVKINCGAIPDQLIESELFGYERGAFSGAAGRKLGRIELAHTGTLFLDEIGELPYELQARLLHVVEDKAVERLGGTARIPVDFRLVAATNKPLDKERVSEFRHDLYYRISTVQLRLPPLAEREQDFPIFILSLVQRSCEKFGRLPMSVTPEALKVLRSYSWPGNIRELDNVIKRAILLHSESDTELTQDDFNCYCRGGDGNGVLSSFMKAAAVELIENRTSLQAIEHGILKEVLDICGGKVMDASRQSGIPKDRFYRMTGKSS